MSETFEPRVQGVPTVEYLVWALQHYDHSGPEMIDLGSSGTPWVQAHELPVDPASFTDTDGPEALRRCIAEHYGRPPEATGLARGTSGALYTVLRALAEPGSCLAVEAPVYEPLLRVAEGLGYQIVRVPRPAEAGYALDPAAVERALAATHTTGGGGAHVLLTDPHNPSGALLDEAALIELAQRLRPRGGVVIVDECYRDFHTTRGHTAAALGPNVVALNSLTKVYGLGWARIGWIFGHERIVRAAEQVGTHIAGHYGYDYAAWGRAAFAQLDALHARAQSLAADKLERLAAFVEAHARHLTWQRPQAGLIGYVRRRDGRSMQPVCETLMQSHGVITAPGSFFGDPSGMRIGCAAPTAQFDTGLARFDAVIRQGFART